MDYNLQIVQWFIKIFLNYCNKQSPIHVKIIMGRTIICNMEHKIGHSPFGQGESAPKFIKLAHLHQLFKGKQQYVLEMLDLFMEQLPDALSKIEQYIKQQDKKGINYEAHTIKSTIKTVGLKELATIVLALEYCEGDTWEEIKSNYEMFKHEAAIEVKALNEERDLLLEMSRWIYDEMSKYFYLWLDY